MTSLVALLSSGKGTWSEVILLINIEDWDNVYLICNDLAFNNFNINKKNVKKLRFDENNPKLAFKPLSDFFKGEIKDFEVALNLTSGTGTEHMMLTSSILKAGLGIRFVYAENKQLKEYKLLEEDFKIDEIDYDII